MAPCRRDLGHAAVRPAARRPAAADGDDDAAADPAAEAADVAAPDTAVTRMRDRRQCRQPGAGFLDGLVGRYGGTRLGRQELDGELIEDREDALWQRDDIEATRVRRPRGRSARIVVAVDPPASARRSDPCCGIVAGRPRCGRARRGARRRHGARARPGGWARARSASTARFDADCAGRRGQPGRRHGEARVPRGRRVGAGDDGAGDAAASGCGPSRWPHSMSRGGCAMPGLPPSWRTRCATSAPTGSRPAARPTGSTRWSGRSPR